MDQPEHALPVRNAERFAAGARAHDAWCSPVPREPALMRPEQDGVDRTCCRADVLFVGDQVARERGRREDERRRSLELRRLRRACSFLDALE